MGWREMPALSVPFCLGGFREAGLRSAHYDAEVSWRALRPRSNAHDREAKLMQSPQRCKGRDKIRRPHHYATKAQSA